MKLSRYIEKKFEIAYIVFPELHKYVGFFLSVESGFHSNSFRHRQTYSCICDPRLW